jgi:hypothetical protein
MAKLLASLTVIVGVLASSAAVAETPKRRGDRQRARPLWAHAAGRGSVMRNGSAAC